MQKVEQQKRNEIKQVSEVLNMVVRYELKVPPFERNLGENIASI